MCFFFSSRRRHTRFDCDWSSDVCSSDLDDQQERRPRDERGSCLLSAASALIAGTAFLLIIIGLTSLISSAIHLLLRDRRRSDLVMLFLVVALPMLGLVPTIVTAQRASERIAEKSAGRRPSPHAPAVMEIAARRAYAYLPSELYTKVATAGTGTRRSVVFPLAGLAAIAFAVQA